LHTKRKKKICGEKRRRLLEKSDGRIDENSNIKEKKKR